MPQYPYDQLGTPLNVEELQTLNYNYEKIQADIASVDSKATQATTKLEIGLNQQTARLNNLNGEISQAAFEQVVSSAIVNRNFEPVATFSDLETRYPNAKNGDAVQTLDNNKTYRFNGTEWIFIENFGVGPFTEVYEKLDVQKYYVSIKDFGAVGDGITDDSAAFLAAAEYSNGINDVVTILIPHGVFVVNEPVWFNTPVCLTSNHDGIIQYNGTSVLFEMGKRTNTISDYEFTPYTLENIIFRGGEASTYPLKFNNFVTVIKLNQIRLENFSGPGGAAILLDGNNWEITMDNCAWYSSGVTVRNLLKTNPRGVNSTRLRVQGGKYSNQSEVRGFGFWLDGANNEIANAKIEGFRPNVRIGGLATYANIVNTYFETVDNGGCIQFGDVPGGIYQDNYTVGLNVKDCYVNLHNTDFGTTSRFLEPSSNLSGLQNSSLENIFVTEGNTTLVKINNAPSQVGNIFRNIRGVTGLMNTTTIPAPFSQVKIEFKTNETFAQNGTIFEDLDGTLKYKNLSGEVKTISNV